MAISVLLHLLLAIYWYWPSVAQPLEQLANVRVVQIARRTPAPPAPTPRPVLSAPPAAVKSKTRVSVPHLTSRGGKISTAQRPSVAAAATPRPTPAPSAAVGCAKPNASPAVSATPDVPDITAAARASRINGVAAVDVSLDGTGAVTGAKVAHSSGNDGLDASAVAMARNATYTPAYAACKGVASTYVFTVKFVAW